MKYLALALALLLAVGSHAAPATDNLPHELVEFRENMNSALTKAHEFLDNIFNKIGNEALRTQLTQRVDEFFDNIKVFQQRVEPFTNAGVGPVMEATTDLRTGIRQDIESLKSNIQDKLNDVEKILEKHKEEYMDVMKQIDYSDLSNFQAKLVPAVESLRSKFEVNAAETKEALEPILETIRAKLLERVEEAKRMAGPYVEEYRTQVNDMITKLSSKAQGFEAPDIVGLQGKIVPPATEIYAKLQEIFGIISETFNKQ